MSIQEHTASNAFERPSFDYEYHEIETRDQFETPHQLRIEQSLRELEAMGYYGDTDIQAALARKRLSSIDYENPATKELITRIPGVDHWLALVPTPRALGPLYNPDTGTIPDKDRLGKEHEIGDELRAWMVAIGDARGLRSRAHMVEDILAKKGIEQAPSEGRSRWLSIASGAAQPMLQAAHQVMRTSGTAPDMTLVDLSSQALLDAKRYAGELGMSNELHLERMNVLRRQGLDIPASLGEIALQRIFNRKDTMKLSRSQLTPESYDVVEAVGILEYVKPDDWTYRYNGVVDLKTVQSGAVTFLKNSYRLVKPGGDLLVGNMLDSHPQLGFTLNVIQWPHIQPRSIDEMMTILDRAGLRGERHVYAPSDESSRVYALYRIHKPEKGGSG